MADLIDRQAAIDAIDKVAEMFPYRIPGQAKTYRQYNEAWSDACDTSEMAIEALPSAQPARRWISCSERLPEEDTEVLISYRYKEGEGDTDHVNIDITSYGTTCFGGREIHTLKEWRQPFDYFHANYEVIAWMPLPTPYREE